MNRALAVALLAAYLLPVQTSANKVDAAFKEFWLASSPQQALKLSDAIIKSGVTFDDAFARLKKGRSYMPEKSGIVRMMNRTNGIDHHFAVNVPENYDPARKYPVRFQLHGGVGGRADNQPRGSGAIGQLAGAEQIYVLPTAWNTAPWWSDDQVQNLRTIVDQLKRTYNVDENRVALAGVSDGGTGAFFIAMRETTLFASFLPLNGFVMVLANKDIDDGQNYPSNLRDKPWFIINGGRDRLYPTSTVEPFTRHLMRNGVSIDYHPQPQGEHNTAWWPQMKDVFEQFVAAHPRDPHPDTLTWTAASGTTLHNRAHWVIIDEWGRRDGEARSLPDPNIVPGAGELFQNSRPSGRVDLVRKGNIVEAVTQNVTSFRLLLSPDRFDFSKPVRVVVNGRPAYERTIEPNIRTLLQWAAIDNDRTTLYGAELKIKVPNTR
jgi:hypothetical protein